MQYPRYPLPNVALVRRHLSREKLQDVAGELRKELARAGMAARVKAGNRVAIAIGSRGVANIDVIARTLVEELKSLDARPFIVPAMGSHGAATAEGQIGVLAELGVTEQSMDASILSSMETVELDRTSNGARVFMDRNAYEADAVVVVNRVKNHTGFRAPIESGLCKLMAIGLGKQRGAETVHEAGLAATIPEVADIMLGTGRIILGVATVENAYHDTCLVRATPAETIPDTDRELLLLANRLMPRVPFDDLDLLLIDWMGKEISGAGVDPNVIGMWRRLAEPSGTPMYRRVAVLGLTPGSHGNCSGIGMVDFITRRLYDTFDPRTTYWNVLTSNVVHLGKLPLIIGTDVETTEVALRSGRKGDGAPRMVRIKSTLALSEFYVTEPLLEELPMGSGYEVVRPLAPMAQDDAGNLPWE